MVGIFIENKKFKEQIEYVFTTVSEVLGIDVYFYTENEINLSAEIDFCNVNIVYKDSEKYSNFIDKLDKKVIIENSNKLFSQRYLEADSVPQSVRKYNLDYNIKNKKDIISIFSDDAELFIKEEINKITSNIDIVSDIFFMLSRYEEVVLNYKSDDEIYNRFSAKESVAYKNNFLNRPIVNEQIELIWVLLKKLDNSLVRKHHWGDNSFAACFTHDVDWIQKHTNLGRALKDSVKLLVRNKEIALALKNLANYVQSKSDYKEDPYWTFEYIADMEKRLGFTSTFYFMTGGETNFDNKYIYNDKRVIDLIADLERDGFECGYHGSFNSYNDYLKMKEEKINLDSIVKSEEYGIRQHFLRFSAPFTWRIQEKLGFLYDCTLSFADSEGFRCGICHPYKPFDILENRVLDIWEIPLIVMETSIMDSRYSGYGLDEATEKVKFLINQVEAYSGIFTFLWHNSSLDRFNPQVSRWNSVYEQIMIYLHDKKCYGSNGKDILKKYINRGE
ncbi:hypothetical protein CSC2_42370 [Clostridium zeae]|uniref:DUF7033 domain-containing protein n=1 Tax=Clostridium zeae TaxID=2759022 RepID=A0ABQ1EG99_9CLOT|nr:polysaccharide deacetylase family protein [Clostridium zeae]GFZ33711.1 hypothetical protein CSC2_42370 [Clostridium zeae]